jgi:hypothetical protein
VDWVLEVPRFDFVAASAVAIEDAGQASYKRVEGRFAVAGVDVFGGQHRGR